MHLRTYLKFPLIVAVAIAVLATASFGIQPPKDDDLNKAGLEFATADIKVLPSLEFIEPGSEKAFASSELQAFFAKHSTEWKVAMDTRSGLAHLIQGKGIALFPGRANSLPLKAGSSADLAMRDVAGLLEGFMYKNAGLLGTADKQFRLDTERSTNYADYYWNVEFRQYHQGVPVDAHLFFRVNNGNVTQFGTNRVAEVRIDTKPSLSDKEAFALAAAKLGLQASVDRGALMIVPTMTGGQKLGELYKGAVGFGYDHLLVWKYSFMGDDDHLYKVVVEAHTGEVVEYLDETRYATVQGDIYPVTNTDPLVTVDFPFCSVSNSGTKITDENGNYTYSGGTASTTLSGRDINMNDNCGSISLSNSTDGNLDFGGSSGTDCSTPGFGGDGNTHSSRSGFYHLTNINRKAASFLPGNTWLDGTLTANMNINDTCNAFWNGSTVNFYRSGGGCANTGELAAVFLHEWAHGMDSNDGNGSAPENGTGEALADTFAFLETRDACIGENFQSSPCHNCGSCTGVRDVSVFAQGGSGTIARPDTITDNSGPNCDRFTCPYLAQGIFPYQGPMGYQGHCESHIASSANWDLTQSLISEYGTEAGWSAMDTIWYGAITQTESAYRVASGGTCNPNASIDGCASNNWYTVYLSVDDDDGNLANGTPNACRIWDAFDAHGIACGSRPQCSTTCTPTPIANAGADVTINEGQSTTIGTAAQSGHTYSWSPGGATTATVSVSPITTTTYTVTATTSCGSAQDSVTVTVIPAGSGGPQDAVFNATYQAPACLTVGSSCDTNALVDGRANLGPETNQPNTINDSCADGTSGSYHSDESNDRIVVSTLDSGNFSEGDTVQIDATVYAWQTGSSDTLDLYYAADASNPSWTLITSITPSAGGAQTLSAQYTLPSGSLQAVRAQFRYNSDNTPCSSGNYNDRDDLVFAVESAGGCTSDAQCDNGLYCDGAETCNLGTGVCESGTVPTCDDGLYCNGTESCNEATDSCDAGTAPTCDDGAFCNGTETCNEATDSCDAGTPPACDDGLFCNGTETCNEATDSCDAGTAPTCDDGLFCNGTETCNESTDSCDAGSDPCSGSQTCNEGTDTCEGGGGAQDAVYDAGLGAPACATVGSECDSVGLLDGRAGLGPESNQPNTLDSCTDGTSGSYHSDESNDRIVVRTVGGGNFVAGATVEIEATVWAWSTGSNDTLDLYYAADANSPSWVYITSLSPPAGGAQTLTTQYTLPTGNLQAVRANFRYNGSQSSCSGGSYDDADDLVFAVDSAPPTGGCTVDDDFESGAAGWITSGTCSTGTFVLGSPTQQTSGGVTTQVGGANSGSNALFTATNSSAGNADVDGGECVVTSPTFNVTEASNLSVQYFHGQRDAGDDASGDYFVLEASTNGGSTWTPFVSIGDVQNTAAWTNATTSVAAGNVQLRVRVSDGSGPGDIIEGGIDDFSICAP